MNDPRHQLQIVSSARRHLTEDLPEAVAAAAFEFITGPLLENPHRVGKRLRPPWQTGTARDEAPIASCTASTTRPER